MSCCNTNDLCKIPIIKECSRNGDAVIAWSYVFEGLDISNMLFFYESEYLNGRQNIKKSIGNGLSILGANTLVFDAVDSDPRLEGKHVGFLKVVENSNQPSTIIQFSITINKKEVTQW